MDNYQITFQTWNKVATLYQHIFMNVDLYKDTHDRFCECVEKSNPAVFQISCGLGNLTKYLLAKRSDFQMDAVDTAASMVELAKANDPAAHFAVLDCSEMGTLPATYDAIVAGFCMPYLSKEDYSKN